MRILIVFLCVVFATAANAKDVYYDLNIDYKTVNFTGEAVQAMAINDSIPAPVLEFTEGDTAVIRVKNSTDDEASIHWHGLLLPQEQDGVPYLTYFPIQENSTFEYRFDLTHAGTYWYHSHTKIDEQRGQYGAIVVHPKSGYEDEFDYDVVVQLSDWTNEDPMDVLRNLKKDGDWYAYKKDSVISLAGYLKYSNLNAWVSNRWQRMEGMDVSDVGYDAFLANGKRELTLAQQAKAGDRVRVRLINSGASTYFDIQQNSGDFNVVAADGLDVKPVSVSELRMGMAETYDVIVTIPESGAYQFSANSIDGSGGVVVTLGSVAPEAAPEPSKPNLYMKMDHGGNHKMQNDVSEMHDMSHHNHHGGHDMATMQINERLDYSMLKTRTPVTYLGELQEYTLRLTGDMESYNWSFNNIPLSRADAIKIDRGKRVRFHFVNESMMHHPLHLHGHFFKVISGNGDHDVLKHTVDVPPMGRVMIEFEANEYKDWLFHCHNLYHAKTGMARVVRYSDYDGNPDFMKAKMNSNEIMDTDWYTRTDLHLFSSHVGASFRYSNNQHAIEVEAVKHYSQDEELEAHYNFRENRWLQYFIGVERMANENELQIGVKYVLPFSIESTYWLNDEGEIHVEAETDFQLTRNIRLELGANTDDEWDISLEYRTSPYWSVGINANETSDVGIGIYSTF